MNKDLAPFRRRVLPMLRALLVVLAGITAPAWAQDASYIGSAECTSCHRQEAALWTGSDHALAWTPPTPEHVLGDFGGTEYEHDGMVARFTTAPDGTYQISVTESDGSSRTYPVHSVAGVRPLQQYLIETEPGRLQSFDVVWDTVNRRWYHLYPDQHLPLGDGLHWTGPYKNWNGRCATCHATGFHAGYDATSGAYHSTQAEIGVGCEACHGPGSEHVAWAQRAETSREAPPANWGFSMDFSDPEALIQQCAGCHSRREPYFDGNPMPGTPYHDAYNLSLLRPGLYQADGQILDEVYVYGSFLQSKMYARGVSCTNCHDPHSGKLVAEGNAVCAQCHNPSGNPDFPTLTPADYDSASHHHHEPGSPGAQCKNCHMVERVYMGTDWRADHSFRVPRPDLSSETGATNACTTCHDDQTPEWAAQRIAEWYPNSSHRGTHYGQILAHGFADPPGAAPGLSDLARDAAQPGIVRATALWLLEQSGATAEADTVEPLLRDPDPLVRSAAVGAQRLTDPQTRIPRLAPMLEDPSRSVRMAAARGFLNAPVAYLPPKMEQALRAAFGEWQDALASRLDYPETQLQLGGMALTMRDLPAAAGAFGKAVEMDPQLVDAWSMLARISELMEGPSAARGILRDALAANPDDPGLLALMSDIAQRSVQGLTSPDNQ